MVNSGLLNSTKKKPSWRFLKGSSPIRLAVVDDFRTANWIELIKYPELVLTQARQLLGKV